MNPVPPPVPPVSRRSRAWIWAALGFMGVLLLVPLTLAVMVWSALHTGRDATALRLAAARASDVRWERTVEFSAGSWLFSLARFGLSFAPIDPDARLALRSVKRAEVAVFEPKPGASAPLNRAAILTETDAVMTRRGWERLIGVVDSEQTVAVYVPSRIGRDQQLDACILVVSPDNLVVVSARTDLDPLLELIGRRDRRGLLALGR